MHQREFAISQALARAALTAAANLPDAHPCRGVVRHQVYRLQLELQRSHDPDNQRNAGKIGELVKWFDDGAIPSNERVVLST